MYWEGETCYVHKGHPRGKDGTGVWMSFGTFGIFSESAVDGGKDQSQIAA